MLNSEPSQSLYPQMLYGILRALVVPALCVCIVLSLLVLTNLHPPQSATELSLPMIYFQVIIIEPVTILIGLLIMRRVPGNICGPALMLWGCSIWGGSAFNTQGVYLQYIAQIFNQGIGFIGLFLLLLYFPTGTAAKPWINRLAIGFFFFCMSYAFLNAVSDPYANNGESNPFHIAALRFINPVIESNFGVFLMPFGLFCIFILIGNYRAAHGIIKQQMRWMAFTGGTFLIVLTGWIIGLTIPVLWDGLYREVVQFVSATWFYISFPLAFGASILQYRLYDIDIIIRRTLIYTVLTGILAALYFGAIILTQQLFRAATGQTSDLAIVVSTLLIAALFSPVRRRVQDTIDRRLYRRKYDVEQTLANFQKNLREDVDMETLKANLVGVVSETMQPTRIALWVKGNKHQ